MVCGVGKILNRHDYCGVPGFVLQDDISFHVFFPRHCEGAKSDGHAVRGNAEPSALARGNHAFPERPISRQ